MTSVARHLIMEEGVLRFWKGAHVMASGCIPSHASYFLLYEKLKEWFRLENEEFEVAKSMAIGSCTTFMHDFFITPADGKFNSLVQTYCTIDENFIPSLVCNGQWQSARLYASFTPLS